MIDDCCFLNKKFPEVMSHEIKKIVEAMRKAVPLFYKIQTRKQSDILGSS